MVSEFPADSGIDWSVIGVVPKDDYFGEAWRSPETVMLVHGVAESSRAWFAWVPHLARHFRLLRPDLRGFGRSTGEPILYPA